MCGIIGYTGSEDVKGVLLDALELLEYRGYDSAGIALADTGLKQTKVYKCAGRVKDLRAIIRFLRKKKRKIFLRTPSTKKEMSKRFQNLIMILRNRQ